MGYDALLFDHDGVLTTPTDSAVGREAARETFEAAGVESPPDAYVDDLVVGVDPEWLRRVPHSGVDAWGERSGGWHPGPTGTEDEMDGMDGAPTGAPSGDSRTRLRSLSKLRYRPHDGSRGRTTRRRLTGVPSLEPR